MTWGVETNVIERFGGAGIPQERISFARDTYTFNFAGTPSEFVATFRNYYGPTMNAFEAAEKNGRQIQGVALIGIYLSASRLMGRPPSALRTFFEC